MSDIEEYNKCNFCKNYLYGECCLRVCSNKEYFSPYYQRIINKAKLENISVSDVVALMNL